METLISSLVDLVGPAMALSAAAAIAVITWALSHFTSQPGTQISVFWGLVTYTKRFRTLDDQVVQIKDAPSSMDLVFDKSETGKLLPEIPLIFDNAASSKFDGARSFIVFSKSWTESVAEITSEMTSNQRLRLLKIF